MHSVVVPGTRTHLSAPSSTNIVQKTLLLKKESSRVTARWMVGLWKALATTSPNRTCLGHLRSSQVPSSCSSRTKMNQSDVQATRDVIHRLVPCTISRSSHLTLRQFQTDSFPKRRIPQKLSRREMKFTWDKFLPLMSTSNRYYRFVMLKLTWISSPRPWRTYWRIQWTEPSTYKWSYIFIK